MASLPETPAGFVDFFGTGQNLVAITKTLFIDLPNPDYLVGPDTTIKDVIAEKVEGLAWGPDLPDGCHLLYVLTDNDLYTKLPTQIYAFSIDAASAGVVYEPQFLPKPLFPPGQVKKILK